MAAASLLLTVGLSGCSDGSLSSMLAGPDNPKTAIADAPKTAPDKSATDPTAREPALVVALAPMLGPPSEFKDAMVRELNVAASAQNIALLVDADAKGDYTLRGNLVASSSGKNVSLSYNWDVLDKAGNRVGRVANEETNEAPATTQAAWARVSPATIKAVATKAIAALAALIKPTQ